MTPRTYLVGGAVRDQLLGLPVRDRDYLVVGATPDYLLSQGFKQVGADFPVFLHPVTGEEYSLARKERSTGRGYGDFVVDFSPEVTLEEDLSRRDLTINAMARDEKGVLHDPFGGADDLDRMKLRHVSDAFSEDPIRILRVARLLARMPKFHADQKTLLIMENMVVGGLLSEVTAERVWKETARALMEDRPDRYFLTLRRIGALRVVFPEIEDLFGVPQNPSYHPEIDTGLHTILALSITAREGRSLPVRFTALVHDLGKALTPREELPAHRQHEIRGLKPLKQLCDRLKVPSDCRKLAEIVTEHHLSVHRAQERRPKKLVELLEKLGYYRNPETLELVLQACEADARGRTGLEMNAYPSSDYLRAAGAASMSVDVAALRAKGFEGASLGDEIRNERVRLVAAHLQRNSRSPVALE